MEHLKPDIFLHTREGAAVHAEDGNLQNAKAYPKRVIHAGNLAHMDDKNKAKADELN